MVWCGGVECAKGEMGGGVIELGHVVIRPFRECECVFGDMIGVDVEALMCAHAYVQCYDGMEW